MRFYHRNTSVNDLSLPHDSGQPVSEERLRALGIKLWNSEGTDAECMAKHRKRATEELGFVDGLTKEYLWEFNKPGAPGAPKMTIKEALELLSNDFIFQSDAFGLLVEGRWYCDVKDPATDSFIRILLEPKEEIIFPAGTVGQFRPLSHPLDSNTIVLAIFKTAQTFEQQRPLVPAGHDIHNHPLRIAYLKSIGAATGLHADLDM
ncbi:hypothetical protein L218DRAFT_573870 [Marasmius fiardii PR-910]|nr:hypothetical protein L218DRAFT_573870 [Marasmius fiardii PR-910]